MYLYMSDVFTIPKLAIAALPLSLFSFLSLFACESDHHMSTNFFLEQPIAALAPQFFASFYNMYIELFEEFFKYFVSSKI